MQAVHEFWEKVVQVSQGEEQGWQVRELLSL